MIDDEHSVRLLILGKGEIARQFSILALATGYQVEIVEADVSHMSWPEGVTLHDQVYADNPFVLPQHTHAIIARAHDGDAASVAALLNHAAERVYLIASARRAQAVITAATPFIRDPSGLARLSAPAGLDLGCRGSSEIALYILAEVQMHRHSGSGRTLSDMRDQRAAATGAHHAEHSCPGKRA